MVWSKLELRRSFRLEVGEGLPNEGCKSPTKPTKRQGVPNPWWGQGYFPPFLRGKGDGEARRESGAIEGDIPSQPTHFFPGLFRFNWLRYKVGVFAGA